MKNDMDIADFWTALKVYMGTALEMRNFALTDVHKAAVTELEEKVYSQWSWNYGNSPPYTLRKVRRFEGCGTIEILLDIGREGKINNIAFYGDFFGNRDPAELAGLLFGRRPEYEELKTALADIDISQYFHALEMSAFLSALTA
jgi:lipoate-protein ligase A